MSATAIDPPRRPTPHQSTAPIRVLIADHDGLARRMMQAALHNAHGITTVPAARDAHETLQHARYYHPSVLILDTALPPRGCIEVIRNILHTAPHTNILTISATNDPTALAALQAGATGHISKDINPHDLPHLITLAAHGEAIIPQHLLKPLLTLLRDTPQTGWRPVHSRLTTREWEIIELLAQRASTQHIAQQLVVSHTTVYSHVKSILRKLNVHSRHDAITAAEHLRREEAIGTRIPLQI